MTFCFINDHVKKLTLKPYLCWLQLILFINFVNIFREFILSHDPHFFGDFLSFQRINFYGMFNLKLQIYTYLFTKYFDFIAPNSFLLLRIYKTVFVTTVDTDTIEIFSYVIFIYWYWLHVVLQNTQIEWK